MLLLLLACLSDPDTAESTLHSAGYTDVQTDGWGFGCGKDDTFATAFTATNPAGERVSGVVCSGWLKGGTIRF